MATTDGAQQGYVYILTNPSFREDWIKIGKSARTPDVRSKELDNTAVPLPFEIYATMKTASYNKVETMLHKILEGTDRRIRKNREFFNVKPDVALTAFYDIAELIPDAVVYLKGEEPKEKTSKVSTPKSIRPKPGAVVVHPSDDLPKGARYSLDGDNYVSMARFGFLFVKQLLADNPSLTFQELEAMFPKRMLGGFQCCGVVAKEDVVDRASYSLADKKKRYRYGDADYLLRTADGSVFYTSTQWERESFKKLIAIAEEQEYKVFIEKK